MSGSGNIGIGTTTPPYKLTVQGTTLTDSSVSVQGAFNLNPLTAPTAIGGYTLSAGSSLGVGTYYYFAVYVTALGETSAGSTLTVITTAGNTTVNLTGIPVSSDSRVTARKIYRTKLNGTSDNEWFLTTISDNVTTTLTDNIADASLTGVGLQAYKVNTTSRYITTNGTQGMILDANLTTLGLSAGATIISTNAAAVRSVFIGALAGENVTTGTANVLVGGAAGRTLTTGGSNTLIGDLAGYVISNASNNTAIGSQTARYLTTGGNNIIIGASSANVLTDGSTQFTQGTNNTILGNSIRMSTITDTNSIVIGNTAWSLGSNTTVLGNDSTTRTALRGNVSMGTTGSISSTLHIKGSGATSATTALRVENTNASASMVVLDNGFVGIGTGSAQYNLDVYGNYHQYQAQGLLARYDISSANANQNRGVWDFYTNAAATPDFFGRFGFKFEGGTADSFKQFQVHIADSTTPKVVINGSGNVGIGTITPSASLHISGSTSGALLIASSSNGPALYVSGSGNVGIGTSAPTYNLEVVGSNTNTARFYGGSGTAVVGIGVNGTLQSSGGQFRLYGNSSVPLSLGSYGVWGDLWIINGNVGVGQGTTAPTLSSRFTIKGSGATSATTALRVENTNASASLVVLDNGNVNMYNNLTVTGSLTTTGGITGSLFGTASYATIAADASGISSSITNNTNNNILTATGTGVINGESNLTFNGQELVLNNGFLTFTGLYSFIDQSDGGTAGGSYSHAQGLAVYSAGNYSHAEGSSTNATGFGSHAEGSGSFTSTSKLYGAKLNTITSGVFQLAGDVTTVFAPGNRLYYNSAAYPDNTSFVVDTSVFVGLVTTITLTNTGITDSDFVVGSLNYPYPSWAGNMSSAADGGHAEGWYTNAVADWSHAEGLSTQTFARYAHAEGESTQANGLSSHAEGRSSKTFGDYSHAEGNGTQAIGTRSHAEGTSTQTIGIASHAEGASTQAIGEASHAEGKSTTAIGNYSHAEGSNAQTIGSYSHAEGDGTQAIGYTSHTEGKNTKTGITTAYSSSISSGIITLSSTYGDVSGEFATDNRLLLYDTPFDGIYGTTTFIISQSYFSSPNTIVELVDTSVTTTTAYVGSLTYGIGNWTGDQTIPGDYSHAEGYNTTAIGEASHAEGGETQAIGIASHAEGVSTQTIGYASHAEGASTQTIGNNSHAEGGGTQAIGDSSHAEGASTIALGQYSHAEGSNAQTIGSYSHAEGSATTAIGDYSHTEGNNTTAGQFAYGPETAITSGVFELYSGYGNLTSSFTAGVFVLINDSQGQINGTPNIFKLEVSSSTYTGTPATQITLVNTSINTSDSKYGVGIYGNFNPTLADGTIGHFSHTQKEVVQYHLDLTHTQKVILLQQLETSHTQREIIPKQ
mgnify:CR=1 FL=1